MSSSRLELTDGKPRRIRDMLGSFSFAYLLCICLVAIPIASAGFYSILAFTRLLNPLMNAGVVKYHDLNLGFIEGVENLKYYLYAKQPVDWRLVGFCALLYLGFYLLKAVQFHSIARFYKLKGSFGNHTRALYYGFGLNRILPFSMGDIGSVAVMEAQGESREKASTVLYTQDLFIWLEIACFFVLGIVLAGWDTSILQVFPAAIFFGVLYFITRPGQRKKALSDVPGGGPLPVAIIRGLCKNPLLLVWLVALSLLAFFLDDVTPYVISQAFTEGPVILNVPFLVIQGGVVAGYLASRIPVTPGTIGQFEFGFGTALLMSGVDLNVAIAIIIIDGLIRHGVAILLFVIVKVFYGVEAKLSSVFELFMGRSSNAVALTGEQA